MGCDLTLCRRPVRRPSARLVWVVAVCLVAGEGRRAVVYETGHLVLSTGWVQPLSVGFVPCDYVAQWRIVNFAVLGRAPGSAAAARVSCP